MEFLFRIVKLIVAVVAISFYVLQSFAIHFVTANPRKRRANFVTNVARYARFMLWLFNIKVHSKNKPKRGKCYLIVSNHLGVFDIFSMVTTVPTLFVTSVEMRETPVLGLLTEMGGCLYVERRSRANIANEIKEIENALSEGFNVVIYPEGKSTNGEKILPFKKSLLMACADSDANILPAVLNVRSINGESFSRKNRDCFCWYDDMPFVKAMWNATLMRTCHVDLEFLEEVLVNNGSDRKEISSKAQQQIEAKFNPVQI